MIPPTPSAVLGTMTFGDTVDEDGARRILTAALDSGVTWIDTANVYAGGETERVLAKILPRDREDIVLATKVGIAHPDAEGEPPLGASAIHKCLAGSLSRLRVDAIDLLYLHQPDRRTPLQDTLETLDGLVNAGTVKRIGVSNFAAWQIEQILQFAKDHAWHWPLIAQQLYSPIARRIEDEYREFATQRPVDTVVYNPLAGGLLTGRHRFDEASTSGRFGTSALSSTYRGRYWNTQVFEAIDALARVADGAGISLIELSLRWVANADFVSGVLLGGSSPEHIVQNLAAVNAGPLPADVIAAVESATDPLRGPMLAYNR